MRTPPPLSQHSPGVCRFAPRHNSASQLDVEEMVKITNFNTLDALIEATVPSAIKLGRPMDLGEYTKGFTESEFIAKFKWGHSPSIVRRVVDAGFYESDIPAKICHASAGVMRII